jgi:hypothetical protein
MARSASCLVTLSLALLATTFAGAAIRYTPNDVSPQSDSAVSIDSEQNYYRLLFREQGIDPNSNKAQIVRRWVDKIRHDPAIEANMSGPEGVNRIFLDSGARQSFMSNGVAHLAPADRLDYILLLAKFLDELVPVNCFGLVDMGAVMNRVSLRDMPDPDTDRYFALLYKILVNNRQDPVVLPSLQQFAHSQLQFSRALLVELHGDQDNIARFQTYAANPALATPADACWATRVTLHAIIAMPDPGRDVMLLHTVTRAGQQADAPAADDPTPASSQPARTTPAP